MSRWARVVPRPSKSEAQYPSWARHLVSNHLMLSSSLFKASYITTVCTTRQVPFHSQCIGAVAGKRPREWRASPPAKQLPHAERSLHAQDVTRLLAQLPPRLSTILKTPIRVLASRPASLHQSASCVEWTEVRGECEGCVFPAVIYVSGPVFLPSFLSSDRRSLQPFDHPCHLHKSLKYSGIWPRHLIT